MRIAVQLIINAVSSRARRESRPKRKGRRGFSAPGVRAIKNRERKRVSLPSRPAVFTGAPLVYRICYTV
jgi:hypothetical protein